MKQTRLDELMAKANQNEITISELAEICGSCLMSLSRHANEIKNRLNSIEKRMEELDNNMDSIKELSSPVFGVISDMEEEED